MPIMVAVARLPRESLGKATVGYQSGQR